MDKEFEMAVRFRKGIPTYHLNGKYAKKATPGSDRLRISVGGGDGLSRGSP